MKLDDIWSLALLSLRDPRAGAKAVLSLGVPMAARWQLAILTAVMGGIFFQLGFLLTPGGTEIQSAAGLPGPLALGLVQVITVLMSVIAVHRIGRAMGGTGEFADALLLIGWLQLIMLGVQLLQVAAMLIYSPFVEILGLFGMVLLFWLLTNFVVVLHGFSSRAKAFAAILIGFFLMAVVLAVLLSILGMGAMTMV